MSTDPFAARSARASRWLAAQSPELVQLALEAYAKSGGAAFESEVELLWLYSQFRIDIDEWNRLNPSRPMVCRPAA